MFEDDHDDCPQVCCWDKWIIQQVLKRELDACMAVSQLTSVEILFVSLYAPHGTKAAGSVSSKPQCLWNALGCEIRSAVQRPWLVGRPSRTCHPQRFNFWPRHTWFGDATEQHQGRFCKAGKKPRKRKSGWKDGHIRYWYKAESLLWLAL